ncbi:MAG: radical SAM family heme chaperone HemW [Alphaproteobacteria bacterium]|nr:radical SAM family heme chaperone HemW [Alphaproteobacteria bacterium]
MKQFRYSLQLKNDLLDFFILSFNIHGMNLPHNLYIHIPFCISKCNYCAFFSRAIAPDWEYYQNQILHEIDFWHNKLGHIKIPTIFFGGGTPSLMPVETFNNIINHISSRFDLSDCVEITLESNPGTLDEKKLDDFITCGVSRLSVGVQSFNDNELNFLGRRHDAKTAIKLLDTAMQKNIRVSADFIYGLPGHNVQNIISLCNKINEIGLQHASLYELTIEKNTPFGQMNLNMPNNDAMADMYLAIQDNIKLPRYEVSNYATHEHICRHNQNIWDGAPYIGLGHGARGRVFMDNTWFEQSGGDIKFEKISDDARAIEKLMTGLRTMRGMIIDDAIKNVLDFDFINAHNDLVKIEHNVIRATDTGILILDDLLVDILR